MQLIDYGQFRRFLTIYLEVEIPDDLSRHLFLSFLKRPTSAPASVSRSAGELRLLFSSMPVNIYVGGREPCPSEFLMVAAFGDA